MKKRTVRQKALGFLAPGRLGSGFILGAGFMLWLAIDRRSVFDEMVLFVMDFFGMLHA